MQSKRKWTFRALAVLLGLSVFSVLEGLCRIIGWGAEPPSTAFAEFVAIRPLFQYSDNDDRWHIAPNRREFFAEDSFAASKAANTFRIFVFGGSTVQGRPFSIPTSFTTFLEIALQTADPTTDWEVVNCGGVSYASYRLLPVMKECFQYQPDLYIVCSGHNEFLECITYDKVRRAPPIINKSYSWLSRLHSFRLAIQAFQASPETSSRLLHGTATFPAEVDAILDHHGGLQAYQRSRLHADEVVTGFAQNLRMMVQQSRSHDVPLLLLHPPSNLRDCPPFKSEFSERTSDTMRQAVLKNLKLLNQQVPSADQAVRDLNALAATDPQFALTWYQLGQALLRHGRFDDALTALIRARDEDICPLRMTSALENELHAVAADTETPLLNIPWLLRPRAQNEIIGDAVLVDHVHPSFRSQQDIALALAYMLQDKDLIRLPHDIDEGPVRKKFDEHLQSLDDLYFLRGRRTLQTLKAWTQGRADGPPLAH